MLKSGCQWQAHNKNDIPLSERQILNALQRCSQIMKEDKLYVRNIIKQIFKDAQTVAISQLNHSSQEMELLSIFLECKKPLNRVHLYESHAHWLQVKLRKYIINQKKKEKEQCLNQFKRQKDQEKTRKMMKKRMINQQLDYRDNISAHNSGHKGNYSQQNRRPQSPRGFNALQNINQTQRHHNKNKHFFGQISSNYEVSSKYKNLGPQSCKNQLNLQKLNENKGSNLLNRFRSNSNTCKAQSGNQNKKQLFKHKKNAKSSQKIQNKSKDSSKGSNNKWNVHGPQHIYRQQIHTEQYPYVAQQQFDKQQYSNRNKRSNYVQIRANQAEIIKQSLGSLDQFSSIKQKDKIKKGAAAVTSKFVEPNQDLYTSPQLLEQCRKFIKKTDRKDIQKINKSNKKVQQVNQVLTSQKKSINAFEQVQCPDYSSPQFKRDCKPSEQKFKSIKQLLRHIFRKSWSIFIKPYQRQQILIRCPNGYQKFIQKMLLQIDQRTNFVSFLQVFQTLKGFMNLNFSFSNIFLLLDVDSKGIIVHSDYQSFMQNFDGCTVQPQILSQLRQKLFRLQQKLAQIFKNQDIVPGCLEYLQLLQFKQIYELGQILQIFQFQIDSGNNNVNNN